MIKLNIYKGKNMRKLTIYDLPLTFTDRVDWDIKPMVKIRRVFEKYNKKKVTEFYGEIVEFENTGLWLMLPAKEIAEISSEELTDYVIERLADEINLKDVPTWRLTKGFSGVHLKKGDYFLGKLPMNITRMIRLQGNTAVLIQIMELN